MFIGLVLIGILNFFYFQHSIAKKEAA